MIFAETYYPVLEEREKYLQTHGIKVTNYQFRVYDACSLVPKGKVTTYKRLSDAIESSPRAVGQALKKNPFAPIVPCHRVVAADGKIGGFFGSTSDDACTRKRKLLEQEGIAFDSQGNIVNFENVTWSY